MNHRTSALRRLFRHKQRNEKGALAFLMMCGILLAVVGIGAFGMDISHNITVRTELQSATDAGALAGAEDLLKPATQNNADQDALLIAGQNTADGLPVTNSSNGFIVTSGSSFDLATNSGTCTVDGSKQINNVLSKLFHHDSDTINTHSQAKCWRSITGVEPNQAFPLMVSADTLSGSPDGKALYQRNIGDSVTFWINSQQYKNAAWTALTNNNTNSNWLKNAIDQLLGFAPQTSNFIPGINIGDQASVANGVLAEKSLGDPGYQSALENPNANWVLPVMSGDPPYTQTRQLIGFITVKFTNVQKQGNGGQVLGLTATITKGFTKGIGGLVNSTGNTAENTGLQALSAGTVKLVQ